MCSLPPKAPLRPFHVVSRCRLIPRRQVSLGAVIPFLRTTTLGRRFEYSTDHRVPLRRALGARRPRAWARLSRYPGRRRQRPKPAGSCTASESRRLSRGTLSPGAMHPSQPPRWHLTRCGKRTILTSRRVNRRRSRRSLTASLGDVPA